MSSPQHVMWQMLPSLAMIVSISSVGLLDFDSFNSMDIEEKWDVTNVWIVTYTLYCGGRHTLTVSVGDETSEREIMVL